MKFKRTLTILVGIAILFSLTTDPIVANDRLSFNYFSASLEQFKNQLQESQNPINLENDIFIPKGQVLSLDSHTPIKIIASDFQFIVEGELLLGDNITITGSGYPNPLVNIQNGGVLYIISTSFSLSPKIISREFQGTALSFDEGSECVQLEFSFLHLKSIQGTALASKIPLNISTFFIEGKQAINSTEAIRLQLCEVIGSIHSSYIISDNSLLSQKADQTIKRQITQITPGRQLLTINESIPDYLYNKMRGNAWLTAPGEDPLLLTSYFTLRLPPLNTQKVATYKVSLNEEDWLKPFHLLEENNQLFTINVCDFRYPVFIQSVINTNYRVEFNFVNENRKLTLWRSDDEGKNWQDVTQHTTIETTEDSLTLLFNQPGEGYTLFCWEVEGLGTSQILRLNWNAFDWEAGGDRSGTDRQEILDDSFLPPNQTKTTNSSKELSTNNTSRINETTKKETTRVTLTGTTLKQLSTLHKDYLFFFHGDFRLAVPIRYIESLSLNSEDTFTTQINQDDQEHFTLTFYINEQPIEGVTTEPHLLTMPYQYAISACRLATSKEITGEIKEGTITFPLQQTGTYQLLGDFKKEATIDPLEKHFVETTPAENKHTLQNAILLGILGVFVYLRRR